MMTKALGVRRSNSRLERLVMNKLFWSLAILFLFTYPIVKSLNRDLPKPLPVIKKLPEYSLTNSFGKPFGSSELKGKVYIANFIFTNCPSSCLRLSKEMNKVQKRVRGLGQNVALVSYSVDPLNDTPKVLYKYARKHHANPFVWTFLTGDMDKMKDVIISGFDVPMGELEEVEGMVEGETVTMFDIAHTEKFVLVDHNGNIRGYYDSNKNDINKLMIDVGLLVNRKKYNTKNN